MSNGASIDPAGPAELLAALRRCGQLRRLGRGEAVFQEGQPAAHWYWLSDGVVQVGGPAVGRRQVAELVLPGDFFGLEEASCRAATAEAARQSAVLCFPRRRAAALLDAEPRLAAAFRELACRRLQAAQCRLLRLGRRSATARVAAFLIELADRADGAGQISIPVTRDGVAAYLGLTSETVSRALGGLRRAGVIEQPDRNTVRLCDAVALRATAGKH